MEPIFFVQLSDIHVNAPEKNNPMFGVDMSAKLRAAFAEIRSMRTKPAFVLISGDLTQDGDADDYRHLRRLIDEEAERTGVPVHVGLGNHDSRPAFREGYLGEEPSEESYYYSFLEKSLRVVMLNSQIEGSHDGEIDAKQLAWLRDTLSEPAPEGTIVVLHHPVTATPNAMMDGHLLRNPADLKDAVHGQGVIGMLSGHIHFHNIGSLVGIPCAAATGVAFGLDSTSPNTMRFLDNSGYNLVTVSGGHMAVQPRMLPGEQRLLYEWDPAKQPAHA
ncbi:metallophosphoesterase family protein [Cohnella zeiphila]|uniref:Metallophosphoesterase n=1 Tax=Cohnella zeiphila TaxID=2761120 RepID=A0A7X0SIH9_9BACL|nr:metallophosphoesterase [Cohnella zeiphila]MBB6730610.1 metallophosphoesterase [Cohnella zeiphila]